MVLLFIFTSIRRSSSRENFPANQLLHSRKLKLDFTTVPLAQKAIAWNQLVDLHSLLWYLCEIVCDISYEEFPLSNILSNNPCGAEEMGRELFPLEKQPPHLNERCSVFFCCDKSC